MFTNGFDRRRLNDHFQRHRSDFGTATQQEYERQADMFLGGPKPSDVLECVRSDGNILRLRPSTDEFGVLSPSKVIRSYYRPNPFVHGFPTNLDYFKDQCSK